MAAQIAAHGRLGRDPKAVQTKTGTPMAVCSMAVDVGEEQTLWLSLVAFNRQAEELLRHAKGEMVSVSGRVVLRAWEDRDGQAREELQAMVDSLVSARTVRPGGRRKGNGEKAGRQQEPGEPFDDALPF